MLTGFTEPQNFQIGRIGALVKHGIVERIGLYYQGELNSHAGFITDFGKFTLSFKPLVFSLASGYNNTHLV